MNRILNKFVIMMVIITNFVMGGVNALASQQIDHTKIQVTGRYETLGSDHWRLDYFQETDTHTLEEMRVYINGTYVETVYPQWLEKFDAYDSNGGHRVYDVFKIEFSLFENVYTYDSDSGYYKNYSVMDQYRNVLTDDQIAYFETEKKRPDPANTNRVQHATMSFEAFAFELIFKDLNDSLRVHTITEAEVRGSTIDNIVFENTLVNEIPTGYQNQWVEIQGKSFYFGNDGKLVKSSWQKQTDQSWKYIKVDGTAATLESIELNGKAYYFNKLGTMVTRSWVLLENPNDYTKSWYYFGNDGAAKTNEWIGSSKAWYYVKSDGKAAQNEWYEVSGKLYYFDDTTKMLSKGWQLIDEHWYYFNNNGSLKINAWVGNSKAWYYVKSSGIAAQNEWLKISGKWYFFDNSTKMVSNSWRLIDNNWYFFSRGGAMLNNEWKQSGKYWYYLKSSGVASQKEWLKLGGKWYFFDSSTKMVTGWKQLDALYYFNTSGAMETSKWKNTAQGWYYLESNGKATKTNTLNFNNCTELKAVYPEGVPKSHPAYKSKMDRDKDGWACELNGSQKG